MDQRTRMFRVWICLAVCMTGGSTLLTWLEPEADPRQIPRDSDDYVRVVQVAVNDLDRPVLPWAGVTLLPWPSSGNDAIMLAAVRSQPDVHFLVAQDGQIHPQTPWRMQQVIDDARQVRIALTTDGTHRRISPLQSRVVVALVDVLSAQSAAGGKLPVVIDDAQGALPPAGTVRNLLAGVPLPG